MPANTKAIFQEMFTNFQDYYVLIGGTATSIILDSQGFKSRTTKDCNIFLTMTGWKAFKQSTLGIFPRVLCFFLLPF